MKRKRRRFNRGVVQVMAENMPIGVGSYVHYDRKLDGRIAGVLSINAFKGVSLVRDLKQLKNLVAKFKMKFIIIKIQAILELQIT